MSIKKPKFPFFLLLFLLIESYSVTFAQSTDVEPAINVSTVPPARFQLRASYRELSKSYYLVDDAERLSQLDMASLIEQSFLKDVEKYYVSEDRMVTRIRFLDSMNAFNYGEKPALLVIDTGGVEMFDKDGSVLTSYRIEDKNRMESIDIDHLYPPMTKLTSAELQAIEENGAIVTDYGDGNIKVEYEDMTYSEGDGFRYQTFYRYDKQKDLIGKEEALYKEIPTGELVKTRRKSTKYVTLPSGACAELIEEVTYGNYEIDDRRVVSRSKRMPAKEEVDGLVLSPNPIDDYLEIEHRNIFKDSEQLLIEIYTMDGNLVKQQSINNANHIGFPIYFLKEGMYLLKVSDNSSHQVTKKFVKF